MKRLLLVILLLLTPSALANAPVVITNDKGGSVAEYLLRRIELQSSNSVVEIKGICYSACTVFISISCVHPSAKFGFHSASDNNKFTIESKFVTQLMVDTYPPLLQQWFKENAEHLYGKRAVYLTGRQVIALGAKKCLLS